MKTTGAIWKAYLASWPEGQWFDDSDETYDGKQPMDSDPADNAVVKVTTGCIMDGDSDGMDLIDHFNQWEKAQTTTSAFIEFPKDKLAEVKAAISALGGKVRA